MVYEFVLVLIFVVLTFILVFQLCSKTELFDLSDIFLMVVIIMFASIIVSLALFIYTARNKIDSQRLNTLGEVVV